MHLRVSLRRITTAMLALGVLVVFAVAVLPRSTTRSASAAGDCTIDASLDSEEQAFLTLINNHRAQNGLPKLAISYTLTRASAWKSKDLGVNAYFAHDDLTRTWVQRVRDCNYGFNTYIGENIAAGVTTAQQAFDIWKNSPGHNANMLGSNYNSIGIGRYFVQGSPYGWYWTTDFGGFDDGWSTIAQTATVPAATLTPTATRTSTPVLAPTQTSTPTPVATATAPSIYLGGGASPAYLRAGSKQILAARVLTTRSMTALIDVEVYNASGARVFQTYADNRILEANGSNVMHFRWTLPAGLAPGTYTVMVGAFSPGWGTVYAWNPNAAIFVVAP